MSHLFISYSHNDNEYVNRLAHALEQEGFSAWVDDRIDYGTTWTGEVQRRLDTCAAFILVMTPYSFESRWVNNELSRAMRKNKPIYPLLLEGEEPWLAVESIQFLDVRGGKLPDERFYQQLSQVAPRQKPAPEPEPKPVIEPIPEATPAQILVDKAPEEEIRPEQVPVEKVSETEIQPSQVLVEKVSVKEPRQPRPKQEKKTEPKPGKEKKPAGQPRLARRKWVTGLAVVLALAAVGTGAWFLREPLHLVASPAGTPTLDLHVATRTAFPFSLPVSPLAISIENADQVSELSWWGVGGVIRQMVLNSMGDTVAVATSTGVYLFDSVDLDEVKYFETYWEVTALAISPDNSYLAIGLGGGNIIQIKQLAGPVVYSLQATDTPRSLAFDSYGTFLAAGLQDGTIQVWSMSDGSLLYTLEGHEGSITSVVLNPVGNLLESASKDGTIRLWQIPEGTLKQTLEWGQNGGVTSIAFSPDGGILAAGGQDGSIQVWSVPDYSLLYQLDGHTNEILSVAFSPTGDLLASGSVDTTIRLWKMSEGGIPVGTLEGHTSAVQSVAFSQDGTTIFSGGLDGTLRMWDVASLSEKAIQDRFSQPILSTAISPDGKTLAQAMLDGSVQLWNIAEGILMGVLEGFPDSYQIGFSQDGETLVSVSSETIGTWRVSDGKLLRTAGNLPAEVTCAAFDPVNEEIAIGFVDATIQLYDFSGVLLDSWSTDQTGNNVVLLEYSPDGQFLAATYDDGTLVVWQEIEPIKVHGGNAGTITAFTFTPDGMSLLLAGEGGSLRSLSMDEEQFFDLSILSIPGLTGNVWTMEFTPDGRLLVLAVDNGIKLVDFGNRSILRVLEEHTASVTSLTFLADGSMLVSSSLDGTTRLWGVER